MTGTVALTAAPTDVGAAASWTAGASYTVEASDAVAVIVETTSATAPPTTTRGHRLYPGTGRRPADVRVVSLAAGAHLWAWAPYGATALVWSAAS